MDVTFLGAVNAIGGNKFLLTDSGPRQSRVLLDFGMQFGDPKSYVKAGGLMGSLGAFYDEFLQPRTNAGLRDLLRLRILPEVDGLYRDDWLVTPEYRRAVERHLGSVPFETFWESGLQSYQDYKRANLRPFVDGVLLTHAHADHFQHLAFLDPEIPVYSTAVTQSIVRTAADVASQGEVGEAVAPQRRALVENGAKSKWRGYWKTRRGDPMARRWVVVQPYEWFPVGDFRAQAIPIDHSVPGACFYIIEGQDGKRVLYTGDFRFHGVYEHLSEEAKRRLRGLRPDALLCEGTRIDSELDVTERDVLATTSRAMGRTKGLVLAEWGWKDASRFETMQQAAKANGRTLLVDPRVAYTMQRLSEVDPSFRPIESYGNVRVYLRRKKSMLYSPEDYNKWELGYHAEWDEATEEAAVRSLLSEDGPEATPALAHYRTGVRADQVRRDPSKYVVQTSYFQMSELLDLDPPGGSHYIKSSCEPFNDEMLTDQAKLLNWLNEWSITSNIAENEHGHHTSGHASARELAAFWELIGPRTLFPIHTQDPQRYAELWPGNVQPPKYGETIRI